MPGSVRVPNFRIFSASVLENLSDAAKRQHANRILTRYRNEIARVVANKDIEYRRDARNGRITFQQAGQRIARVIVTANRLLNALWTQLSRYLDIVIIRPTRFRN